MSEGRKIYQAVKAGEVTIASLCDASLAELIGHVARRGKINGTAGRIGGEAMAVAVMRFMKRAKSETENFG